MSLDVKWTNDPISNPPSVVVPDSASPLKEMIVSYVGEKLNPEDDAVTVEMVVEVMAQEFPELALAVAEENWIRGYEQGLQDLESFGEE
jgi:hypothetical protein